MGVLMQVPNVVSAIVAPGYFKQLNSAQFQAWMKLGYDVMPVTQAEFDAVKASATNGTTGSTAAIAALPSQIPLTVQGASEDFINGVASQITSNVNQAASIINGNNVIMRDQVKAHVTSEADRVIAAI